MNYFSKSPFHLTSDDIRNGTMDIGLNFGSIGTQLTALQISLKFIHERFVQFYYSYLSESALNGSSLDQQLDPNPSLASETLGNGRRIPALLFS